MADAVTADMSPAAVLAPGRSCPADYRTDPSDLATMPSMDSDVLYVAGGLYGNMLALHAIRDMLAAERGRAALAVNGDAHWFDADPAWFFDMAEALRGVPAIRGNVEAELVRPDDIGAGCGCAYPEGVAQDVVDRSNAILARLKAVADAAPAEHARLAALPATLAARVGDLRIGIVHGDPWSIAGWRFAREVLDAPSAASEVVAAAESANVAVFASTHTCGAGMRAFDGPRGRVVVVNNGAAGMGNFAGDARGLVTRIALEPSPKALYATRVGPVVVEAVPVMFDVPRFLAMFDAVWPSGSPAERSYRQRIVFGSGETVVGARPV
jgi:hypothetical protein